jgi:hypothetical protein
LPNKEMELKILITVANREFEVKRTALYFKG